VPYSGLMLAARITLPHFSFSVAMRFPKSAGEPRNCNAAQIREPRLHLGIGEARVNLLVDFEMTSAGVPFGAKTPYPKWAT
jgi:hypothetical protein